MSDIPSLFEESVANGPTAGISVSCDWPEGVPLRAWPNEAGVCASVRVRAHGYAERKAGCT